MPALFLLDMCCHLKEVGGIRYQLVKDSLMKPDPTCKDKCVYQKKSPLDGGFYCFRHGELFSKCLEKQEVTSDSSSTSTDLPSTETTSSINKEPVILITGGTDTSIYLRNNEIFNPFTRASCSLRRLPKALAFHTFDRGLACGGSHSDTRTTCMKWSPDTGTWTQSHTLRQWRYGHVSWATASGVYLIGSWWSPSTSEKVKLDGSVEEGFSLKYNTSFACSIPNPDDNEVIITGGNSTLKTVSVYSEAGWQRDLASLNQGRRDHACGSFVNGGKKFIMVIGGYAESWKNPLDSTEIFTDNVWRTVAAKLPAPMWRLRVATINNRVLSFGGRGNQSASDKILEFNQDTESWTVIGAMKEPRSSFALSVVSFDDYEKWCN